MFFILLIGFYFLDDGKIVVIKAHSIHQPQPSLFRITKTAAKAMKQIATML
jgi:hypothetical protein